MSETATKTTWQNHPIDNPNRIHIDLQFTEKQFKIVDKYIETLWEKYVEPWATKSLIINKHTRSFIQMADGTISVLSYLAWKDKPEEVTKWIKKGIKAVALSAIADTSSFITTLEQAIKHIKARNNRRTQKKTNTYAKNVLPKDVESDWLDDYLKKLQVSKMEEIKMSYVKVDKEKIKQSIAFKNELLTIQKYPN